MIPQATNNGNAGKDTIYIDVDDEITTIIDKVRSSNQRIVALVLPKRASVFQSVVNMKLLKRSAETAKKHLVLITSEAGLLPLAGAVGLLVAKNLQTKPEIPPVPGALGEDDIIDAASEDVAFTAENAGDKPIGELAASTGTLPVVNNDGGIETLALEDEDVPLAAASAAGTATTVIPKKDKKLKVPNFNRFRLLIALGVLALILLIVGLYVSLAVLPKAIITIKTDASAINSSLDLTLDTTAKSLNKSTLTVPAQTAQVQKTQTQQVPTTGSKNNGDKASGSVTMNAGSCSADVPSDVPAGTGLSSAGQTYITQTNTSFAPVIAGGKCVYKSAGSTAILAQAAGAKYNISSATFTVAGRSSVTASGSASGGTDNIVKVVQQSDIDGATQKLASVDAAAIKKSLSQQLQQDGVYPLPETFDAGSPTITSSSSVGDQADTVTVTAVYTYTMYGTDKANLDTLLNDDIKSQVDTSKETILTNGLSAAQVRVLESSATSKKINLQTTGTVGPELHLDDIKKQAAGKKSGNVVPQISNLPGVTDVKVKLSPFWVSSIPTKTNKITIIVEKPIPKK